MYSTRTVAVLEKGGLKINFLMHRLHALEVKVSSRTNMNVAQTNVSKSN